MKKTRTRSIMVLLMTLAFFAGVAYHIVNLTMHSAEWASNPINGHISDTNGLAHAGKIYDINGVVLAESIDGKRTYHDNEEIRKACLHVVGDNSINIATAVQTVYRSELGGYSMIFGLGAPDALQTGNDIKLTIDSTVQKAAYEALGSNRGAVVVYNYKTGAIVCMVSTPTYDPANVPSDIETNDAYNGAYINRAISATYPPGSTFKLVTGATALTDIPDVENRTYHCEGSTQIGGKDVTCFEPNGDLDFKEALAQSCNIYFGQLAVDLGKDAMTKQAEKMGFNSKITFDNITTATSVYKESEATENQLAWSGVGQDKVLETPMNMAMISAAIANGGTPIMPYLIESQSSLTDMLKNRGKSGSQMMSKEVADKLYEMMDYTVETNYGKSSFSERLDVCAKTGTAEINEDGEAHAWVTGFCKDEKYPYAFSVIVERGNSGYRVAIPAASQVLNAIVDSE